MPAPSRQEKLKHLDEYTQNHDSISDDCKSRVLALISRGLQVCEGKARDPYPYTASAFENDLYNKSKHSTKPEFVESFLMGSVQHEMSKEIDSRVSKIEDATKIWIKGKKEISEQLVGAKKESEKFFSDLEKMKMKYRMSLVTNIALLIAFAYVIYLKLFVPTY